ncbi:hypothetical protein [Lachnospira multipara]|uniref:hypothetical protein n=1 Tax=Lachnospira multipara TaxID=28051 RepID=UPI0003F949F1|nr:hypothetical protein [Lachnospira multipara]
MKKTKIIFLLSLVILIISTLYVPVKAGDLLSIEATTSDTRNIHISGTTDSDVYAIILRIYYIENADTLTTEDEFIAAHKTIDVRSIEVTNNTYDLTIDLGQEFNIFGYNGLLVYASDYDGGSFKSTIVQYINTSPTNSDSDTTSNKEESNTITEVTTANSFEENIETEAISISENVTTNTQNEKAANDNIDTGDFSKSVFYLILLLIVLGVIILELNKNKKQL